MKGLKNGVVSRGWSFVRVVGLPGWSVIRDVFHHRLLCAAIVLPWCSWLNTSQRVTGHLESPTGKKKEERVLSRFK